MAGMIVRSRKRWGAKPPRSAGQPVRWRGTVPVAHHTAGRVPQGRTRKLLIEDERRVCREIQAQHMAQGWADIGYHYLVMPSGRVYAGRKAQTRGAHAGTNPGNAAPGIVIVGNLDTSVPAPASVGAFNRMHRKLRRLYRVAPRLVAHGDLYPTACPGRYGRKALGL